MRPHIHVPFDRVQQYIDFIREKTLNLEIYFSASTLDTVTERDILAVRDMLDYRPSLSFHAPFIDLSPGAVDSKVRDATISRFSHVMDIADILRPKAIVFHSGYEKWKYALNIDLWLEKSLMTWQPLNKKAAAMGIKIAIENIFEDEPENLKLLMKTMNSENFGICFDTGHCHLFSRVPLEDWISALKPHIIELHLHDNDRTSDQHLPVSDGSFDFERFFQLLGDRNCIYTLEAHSPQDVLKSIKALQALRASSSDS